MAKVSNVNSIPASGAHAIFDLKTVLKAAGWTVPRSSDGTTYNATGDQITHGGSGAGGMQNARAWFVIQSPNGEHQWCFQKETGDNAEWRVKVSALDGFTGGSPDATTVPSATDEQVLIGSGTDASPTFVDMLPPDGTYRFNTIAENAAIGTAVPIYGFWAFAIQTGTSFCRTFICQEPMDPDTFPELSSGTRAAPVAGDPDPCVYVVDYISSAANCAAVQMNHALGHWNDASPKARMWFKMNYVDEAWVLNQAMIYRGSATYGRQFAPYTATKGMASNPYNGADDLLPIYTGRSAGYGTQVGSKGACQFLKMKCINKSFPDTLNLATDAKVYLGVLVVPWEDGTTPLA